MALTLRSLDPATRTFMIAELQRDIATGTLHHGKRMSPRGIADLPTLMNSAATTGDDSSLAAELRSAGRMLTVEPNPTGGTKKVPSNAAELFAEGEFNRLYLRGICLRAIQEKRVLKVYRARSSSKPRPESEEKIGEIVDPALLLQDLRDHKGMETLLKLPTGAGSGLSAELV